MADKTGSAAAQVVPALFYQDPNAALDWLEKAFGFETCLRVTGDDGVVQHAEMEYGNGRIMLGGMNWADWPSSPKAIGGKNTQCIHVQVKDVMAHFYGDKIYRVFDPEGHFWTFGQTMRVLSDDEMEKASPGLKVEGKE